MNRNYAPVPQYERYPRQTLPLVALQAREPFAKVVETLDVLYVPCRQRSELNVDQKIGKKLTHA